MRRTLGRPVPEHRRGVAFVVAVTIVLGMAIGLEAIASPTSTPSTDRSHPGAVEAVPVAVQGDAVPDRSRTEVRQRPQPAHSDPWTLVAPEKRHINRATRVWMRTLLDYRFGRRAAPPKGGPFVDPELTAAITRSTFPLVEKRSRLNARILRVEFGRYRQFVSAWVIVDVAGVQEDNYVTFTRGPRGWWIADWNELRNIALGLRHGATE